MAYKNFDSGSSLTLTPDERASEARCLLDLLAGVDSDDLVRRSSGQAFEFLTEKWLAQGLLPEGAGVPVTEAQLLWLRDLWGKFQ